MTFSEQFLIKLAKAVGFSENVACEHYTREQDKQRQVLYDQLLDQMLLDDPTFNTNAFKEMVCSTFPEEYQQPKGTVQ